MLCSIISRVRLHFDSWKRTNQASLMPSSGMSSHGRMRLRAERCSVMRLIRRRVHQGEFAEERPPRPPEFVERLDGAFGAVLDLPLFLFLDDAPPDVIVEVAQGRQEQEPPHHRREVVVLIDRQAARYRTSADRRTAPTG